MKVSVVLPTKNEEENIAEIIERCREALKEFEHEVIVVDASSDATPDIAERMGCRVIRGVEGYGRAYIEGFKVASGDVIAMLDADGSYDPAEIPKLIKPIADGDADFVIGSRFRGDIRPGSMPWLHRYVGNPLLTRLTNALFGTKLSDVHSGMRAIRRDALRRLNLSCPGMEFATEMVLECAAKGLRIMEVPITYLPRKGRSKLRSFRDGWRHLRLLLLLSPTFLFLLPSALLIAAGLLLIAYVLILEPIRTHTLVLGSLLVILGVQTFFFGISSKIYAVQLGFAKGDKFTRYFSRYGTLEEGLLLGFAMVVAGIATGYAIVKAWLESGFGELNQFNAAIIAMLVIAVGVQVIFSSLFISSLLIKRG